MDEMRWCPVLSDEVTIATRGAESVTANFSGDPRDSLTVITIITAAGEKLSMHVICKGTTTRWERRYQGNCHPQIAERRLVLCHQCSGWTDTSIAKSVVDDAPNHSQGRPHCPLWDVFSAHRHEEVRSHVTTRRTQLVFVPPPDRPIATSPSVAASLGT